MKLLLLIVVWSAFLAAISTSASGQQKCGPVTVLANADVPAGEFTLADLLAPGACPAFLHAAARVRLGSAPLTGSVRVLEDDQIRGLFQMIGHSTAEAIRIPQRISVRRAGARATCTDIGEQIFANHRARPPVLNSRMDAAAAKSTGVFAPSATDCGAAGRILLNAPLELTRTVWDPRLGSWDVSARCTHTEDCVPFMVRMQRREFEAGEVTPGALHARSITKPSLRSFDPLSVAPLNLTGGDPDVKPLVRPGETVTLLWDQDGIRLVVPAVCLDRGAQGQQVRARILRSGRIVPAVVVRAGSLRAAS